MRKHLSILIFSLFLSTSHTIAQTVDTPKAKQWIDSVMNSLTPDERIGQLFMVAAFSNKDSTHVHDIIHLVRDAKIGGLCFFQGGPVREAVLTNFYQSVAKVPLLISMDAEWGISMRLDSTIRYPKQMTLGAIADNQLIYDFGKETARQCKRIGIHLNFAPVVDVNNNPRNPVINDRSFGEDKYKVAAKGIEYMRGMQDNGVLANAKHFPGHGNTDKDSHFTLPVISRSKLEMDSLELYPFKELIKRGLSSAMVAHLFIPAYDSSKNAAASISKAVITDLLKDQLKFNGLIFTDALNMKAVASNFPPGVIDVKALLAGNDMCLYSENVPVAISEIKKAILNFEITQDEIDLKVRRILFAKYQAGLNNYQPVSINGIYEDLNSNEAKLISMKLYENAITLLENRNNLVPLKNLEDRTIAAISIGADINNEFLNTCQNYAPITTFALKKDASLNDFDFLNKNLENYNTVVVGLHDMSRNEGKNFSISKQTKDFLGNLSAHRNVILVVFGNAYSLRNFDNMAPIVLAYEDNEFTRSLSAQLIFGGIAAKGTMPVTASPLFQGGDGYIIDKTIRLKYTLPEEVGIDSKDLSQIDNLVNKAISNKATPGCQILVAKDGKVIYKKSFGTHTYESYQKVSNNDLYDLASLTKILSTNLAVMEMVNHGKLDINKKLSHYDPLVKGTNKKNILIKDLLTHRAGLIPFIPFWKESLIVNKDGSTNYANDSSQIFPTRVADRLFLRYDYQNKIKFSIYSSDLKDAGKYVYSDLSFYFMKEVVEHYTKQSLSDFVQQNYYKKLGLSTMTYNPLKKFLTNRIIPTENDTIFRKQLLDGYVHDQGAAMLGGIAGHAGLFSNANDVAIIMQMLLNNGVYGDKQFYNPSTVEKFTAQQLPNNRRGLGFDKPEFDLSKSSPTCKSASLKTFGHTGFTGTCAWADPENGLVYIFLSNRINPSAENKKLLEMNVRTDIQEVIYQAINKKKIKVE